MSNTDEFKERPKKPSRCRRSPHDSRLKRGCPPWLLPTVLVLCLVSAPGCSSLINAPVVYGGTKALLDMPFPIEAASLDLGAGGKEANSRALVLINVGWVIDFPLTAILDTVLLPVAIPLRADGESSWWDFWH